MSNIEEISQMNPAQNLDISSAALLREPQVESGKLQQSKAGQTNVLRRYSLRKSSHVIPEDMEARERLD